MFCTQCGVSNADSALFCSQCGTRMVSASMVSQPEAPQSMPPPAVKRTNINVPNHLVWSILSTLFCCIPFGVVAIVYSAQVDTKLKQKDYEGAKRSASNAKTWNWVSLLVGLLTYGIFIVVAIIGLVNSGKW